MEKIISITVQKGQTLLDISIQYLGSAKGVVEVAKLNSLSITQDLQAGQVLKVDTSEVINSKMVDYLKEKNIIPTTN